LFLQIAARTALRGLFVRGGAQRPPQTAAATTARVFAADSLQVQQHVEPDSMSGCVMFASGAGPHRIVGMTHPEATGGAGLGDEAVEVADKRCFGFGAALEVLQQQRRGLERR
jgi:hypothetical protein